MGRGADVWQLLAHSPDPTVRSYLIERLVPGGASARTLEELLDAPGTDPSVRRAVVLALGSFGADRPAALERKLLVLFESDPDPGVHAAAEWVLRQWGREADAAEVTRRLASGKVEGERRWFVNARHQTFAVVTRGASPTGRRLAVASREVTVAEYEQFCKEWLKEPHRYEVGVANSPSCPVNSVSWYKAAAFCNWLSEKDGMGPDEWCYKPNAAGRYAEGMGIHFDYAARRGYRLPTAAERELAAAAGARTSWACGDVGHELLARYARVFPDSGERSHPVGSLKPNDLGLFDMLGNAVEWCHDTNRPDHGPPQRLEPVENLPTRAVRGGSFNHTPGTLNLTVGLQPYRQDATVGFRPVRTLP
jgi:formylglycine-generating enzyme required for sulfatase activity